ncbi:MAG: RsmG family class I SAM-dependent methyltransferase, partial [Rhodanobacteraceae bacterium]
MLQVAGVGENIAERLAAYGIALLDANRRMNLTGAETLDELLPHLLDSLSVADYARTPHVDVGSGGGLPALPIALATGVPVTMVESTAKKGVFLRAMLSEFGLSGNVVA